MPRRAELGSSFSSPRFKPASRRSTRNPTTAAGHATQAVGNAQNQFNQTKASAAKGGGKKVLIFASIGGVTLISLIIALIVYLLGDDDRKWRSGCK
jgi:hypothetical protein